MVEAIRQGDIPGVQLRCRLELPVPASDAWRWLTELPRLARWAGEARHEPGPEGSLELECEVPEGRFHERGRTLELDAGRRWVLAFERLEDGWQTATRLTFELTETATGCELSILQQGFEHLPLSRCLTIWETYRHRWRDALGKLGTAIGSSAGGPSAEKET